MALSTVGAFNKPRTRMVLMKEIRQDGIVFFTNSNSRKGNHIVKNKNVSLNFYWKSIERQVLISGKVKKISSQDSDNYFRSRNRKSQIGAWTSKQSQVLKNKSTLKTNNVENDTRNITLKINQTIEEMIIKNPTQWIWSHKIGRAHV